MTKAKAKAPLATMRASVTRLRTDGEHLVARLQRDARKLITRSRSEVLKDVGAVRHQIEARLDRAIRDLERRVVKQLHAASEEQVRKLERRMAKLEAQVSALARAAAAAAPNVA